LAYHRQAMAPYLNPKLSIKKRVSDLLKRMSLAEKIGQMNQYIAPQYANALGVQDVSLAMPKLLEKGLVGSFLFVNDCEEANALQKAAETTRLKVPLLFGIDAVHGLCPVKGATIFPSPIGLASTWDLKLAEELSAITALETRVSGMHWAFYPVLDVARDPRWGRTAETFGEDPFLVTCMGIAAMRGLQGRDLSSPDSVLACIKHFVAPGQPLGGRNTGPIELSERTLRTMALPAFEACVKAGALSVMAAYNELNGVPCHASERLLTGILREEWGFKGFVVSDWGGIEKLVKSHHVAETQKDAVKQAVLAGVDMHMHGDGFAEPLKELVEKGEVSKKRINAAVSRILDAKFRLGLFENRYVDHDRAKTVLSCPVHKAKELEAARKSIVLLKN